MNITTKNPAEQDQHIITEKYLYQFSFIHKDKKRKVCYKKANENRTNRQVISKFSAETNFFDIDSSDPGIARAFEGINGDIETQYHFILSELTQNKGLSEKRTCNLLQYASNLISRSTYWRANVEYLLNTEHRTSFFQHMLAHVDKTEEEFNNISSNELLKLPTKDLLNRAMALFGDHLFYHLCEFEIVFLNVPSGKGWFTSDNPVVVSDNHSTVNLFARLATRISIMFKQTKPNASINIISPASELYFPLTSTCLAYIRSPNAKATIKSLRKLNSNTVNEITDETFDFITKKIMENSTNYLICPFDIEYESNGGHAS